MTIEILIAAPPVLRTGVQPFERGALHDRRKGAGQ